MIVLQILKNIVSPNPKFRIACRHNKFVPQEFIGIWKVGIYVDIAKSFYSSEYIYFQFEHENITEAELVIERRMGQLKNNSAIICSIIQL
jgi:hypothetical protein